ncbi:hypothetical protein U9M48_026125 [Paspalum notatum var. saurae]|uniref:Exocyst subunit Exo70 family protein n=1 Tax=Paspalum notatum var. saurae TaxID=547442 RepID=A0AAQ3TUP1_PASNO
MESRDGVVLGSARSWTSFQYQHGQTAGSSSYSSKSGTVVSTGYTFSGSYRSSLSMEGEAAIMHLDLLGIHDDDDNVPCCWEETTVEELPMTGIDSMVQEFFAAAPSSSSGSGGDMSVLRRWFTEMGVDWVLRLAADDDASSAAGVLQHTSDGACSSWTHALSRIIYSATASPVPTAGGSISSSSMMDQQLSMISEEEDEELPAVAGEMEILVPTTTSSPYEFLCARFIHEAMLKMLIFVDVVVAAAPTCNKETGTVVIRVPYPYQKINILLGVRSALSEALSQINATSILWTPSAQVKKVQGELVNLLCTKDARACEAIWSTLEEIRACILMMDEEDPLLLGTPTTTTPQGTVVSSDIHKVTWSVMSHISFLLGNYLSMSLILSEAASQGKYKPQIGHVRPLDSMIMEMTSCLEGKLASISESFSDQALRFLFLLNNSDFIRERLQLQYNTHQSSFPVANTHYSSLKVHVASLLGKSKRYMERYLQVAWAPMLSYLFDPMAIPVCFFGKYYSPLSKFEFEFQKTYTTQKLWKVPDPTMRRSLRTDITQTIIPCYSKYIQDNNITTAQFAPRELEEMLRELFEG